MPSPRRPAPIPPLAERVAIVLVTAPDRDVAERLVRSLLDERLVACGNIVPGVLSLYCWQGRLEREEEVLIVLKTTAALTAELVRRVPALHPYEIPEVLVVPVSDGYEPYIDWVAAGCGDRSED